MTPAQEKIYTLALTFHRKHGEIPPPMTLAKQLKCSRQYVEEVYGQLIKMKLLQKKRVVSRYALCGSLSTGA